MVDDVPKNGIETQGAKNIKQTTFLDDLPLIQYPETFEKKEFFDEFMERPNSVEEFIQENNLTQREIDLIYETFDETRFIDDYIEIKPGVTAQELRISIEGVGLKTPNIIVTRYIDDAYKTFDKVEFPNPTLKDRALLLLNRKIINTFNISKEWIYDPKGGGYVMGEGTKLNEYLLNVQGIFPTERIDPAGNRIDFEQQFLDEILDKAGVKMLGEGDYWDNLVSNIVAQSIDDLTIEGEIILDTPQLDTPTNVVDDINKLNQELNTKYADVIDNDYGLNFELRDGRLHIIDMYLKDAERGKGIGSEIFDEIKQFADNNNLEISLYNDGNFNTTFWENKGFQEWSLKNNVDWANTPDDKLGLFILDADTPPTDRPTAQRVPVDDDIPSVWKTIEYVDDNPVVKNPGNFWLESSQTLFGEEFLKEEVERYFIKTNEPFELSDDTADFLRKNYDIKIEDNLITYQELVETGNLNQSGDDSIAQQHHFQNKYGEEVYSINRDRAYFDNPVNQEFIQNKLIPALETGNLNQLTDVEKNMLTTLIYRLQAYETSGRFTKSDQKADIIKKVFMGDVPVVETGLYRRPSFVDEVGINQRVVDLLVDNQKTIKKIAIVALKKHQNQFLPDSEYMLVFRAGDLGFHGGERGLSSFSKSYRIALQMLDFQGGKKDPFGLEKGEEIRAYLVPTKQIVDTEALGIRGGILDNEKEILAFDEDAIPLDTSLDEEGIGNIVERIVEGEELSDNDVLEAIERHEVRKTTTRAGVDLIDQEFPNHSERVRKVAQGYASIFEAADPVFDPITIFSDELGIKAADIFDALPQFDPEALPHYEQFIAETNAQYRALLDEGIVFELVDEDPYTPNKQGHAQMMEDLDNGRFKVLATESGFGSGATATGNPMLKTSKFVDVNGRLMLENDVFRAVHDSFGHGMRGNTFGPIGEYNAFLAHSELYSDYAIRAMATETLGQNTWTNYGPHMRDESGRLVPQGDPNYKKPSQRPFSDQKVALFPEEVITEAKSVAKTGENLITPEGLKAYSKVINNAPELANQIYDKSKRAVGKLLRGGLRGLQVFDPGDIVIEQGLIRALPRLGLAAISYPLLIAYVAYESTVLLSDIGRAASIAFDEQEELLGPAGYSGGAGFYDKEKDYDWKKIGSDTWKEMGAISDTWSLSWRISEPIIDYVFSQEPVQEAVGAGMQTYATMRENR